MQRLACVFVVFAAACGTNGPGTGAASVTGATPAIKSAFANSFTGADGAGTMVLGWTINFSDSAPGADCASKDTKIIGSLGIYTNQPAAAGKKAMLATGDISIVSASPPTVAGTAAANMGAMGVSSIVGIVTIGAFHLDPNGVADHIDGSLNAGGQDGTGGGIPVTGMFVAPVCD